MRPEAEGRFAGMVVLGAVGAVIARDWWAPAGWFAWGLGAVAAVWVVYRANEAATWPPDDGVAS